MRNYFSILILLLALHALVAAQQIYQHEEKLEGNSVAPFTPLLQPLTFF